MKGKGNKYISKQDALKKLQRYCAYQDRCHREVRSKLLVLGIRGEDLESIIVDLIEHDFLNEERFACSFARGKFNYKHWGRIKIEMELRQRDISTYCIQKALKEINEEAYIKKINYLLVKKKTLLGELPDYELNNKLVAYLYQKGYEKKMIWNVLKNLNYK